jgi:hypothetical protein
MRKKIIEMYVRGEFTKYGIRKATGLNAGTITRYMDGKSNYNIATEQKIAKYLGL